MKRVHLYILGIVIIPVLAYFYVFAKLAPLYQQINAHHVSDSTRYFAARVEAGELTNEEISDRLYASSRAEEKIESGIEKIGFGSVLGFLAVGLIALLQALLVNELLKTHNSKLKRDAESGAP